MKRLNLLICFVVCALLGASVFSEIYNGAAEEPIADSGSEAVKSPELLTSSIEQVDEEEVSQVLSESQLEMANLSARIRNLEDKNLEPQLQRQMEQLKLQCEIEDINCNLEKARKRGDSEMVAEYTAEIERLATIDEPVVGDENEQPAP